MKLRTARLTISIISIILFFIVILQSCAVGIINTWDGNGESTGTLGFLLSVCFLVGGIVGIAGRSSKNAVITTGCFYGIGGLLSFLGSTDSYGDLIIWAVAAIGFSVVFFYAALSRTYPSNAAPPRQSSSYHQQTENSRYGSSTGWTPPNTDGNRTAGPVQQFCSSCGNRVQPDQKFCSQCGKNLNL